MKKRWERNLELFHGNFSTCYPSNFEEALFGLSVQLNDETNSLIATERSDEKIREALFQIYPNKAPDIDGMHVLVYQKF